MNVKIETKEKFTVITPEASIISANMTEGLDNLCDYASPQIPHLVINMSEVKEIFKDAAHKLCSMQQAFYERNHSFVICCLTNAVEATFEQENLIDIMNVTPTESEAWDIVQMEEIERELMADFDDKENT